MSLSKIITILFALFLSPVLWAANLDSLATIRNDRNPDVQSLSLIVSGTTPQGLYIKTVHKNRSSTVRKFSAAQIAKGAVLDGDDSHDAIILTGNLRTSGDRIHLKVKYLSNGLLGNYKSCKLNLVLAGNDQWQIQNAYNGSWVDRLFVKTWALGISKIEGICP